jgi:pSer/pThr/pTyr-binding forkhead associated (FHA) protein
MALRFIAVATDGTVAGAQIDEIIEGDPIVIGRDEAVDFVIPEPTVSRRHVEVRATVDGWEIEDLGRLRGSWSGSWRW